jgi:polyketide biosynthesis enoyl-CoA hydratase PksH
VSFDDSRLPVIRVTLTGAVTGNRLGQPVVDALLDALDRAECAQDTTVFVIDAQGDTFSAGMALDDLGGHAWRELVVSIQSLLARLAQSHLVTVAVVNGAALGGGVGLAAACDHVIAGAGASFRLTEVLVGLIPAVILPVLSQRVGTHRAFSLALTAQPLSGPQAAEIGLVDTCTDDDPKRALVQLIRRLRAAEPGALQALKRYHVGMSAPVVTTDAALQVLAERLADPRVHARLRDLRCAGLIP